MKPVQIGNGEWLYKGCFIQKQFHPNLMPYHIFQDTDEQRTVGTSLTFIEAKKIAEINKVDNPLNKAEDFLK